MMSISLGFRTRIAGVATLGMLLLSLVSPAGAELWERYLKRPHGPYRGRVIDAETREPLAGAVVVAIWDREKVQILQSSTVFYEAREVLTDADGTFVLEAGDIERNAPSKTLRPWFVIFTPGYGSYNPFSASAPQGSIKGNLESAGATVELPRLMTRKERLDVIGGMPPSVPDEKMPNLLRLMNMEEISLGLQPTHMHRGK